MFLSLCSSVTKCELSRACTQEKIDDKGYAQCSCLTNEYTNLTAGIMIFERGNGLYIGGWNKGRYHGFGRYEETNGVSYEGGWKDGLMHGHGKFTWPQHGGIFLGEFDKDKRIQGKIFDNKLNLIREYKRPLLE